MLKFDTLERRMALLFVAVLVVVQAIVFGVVDWATATLERENLRTQLTADVRAFTRMHETRSQQVADAARVLTADFGFRQAIASRDHNTVLSALVNQRERLSADLVLLLTPEGKVFASTGSLPGTVFPYRSLLQAAEGRGQAHDIVFLGTRAYRLTVVPVLAPLPIAYLAVGRAVNDRWAQSLYQEQQLNISFLGQEDGRWRLLGSARPPAFAQAVTEQLHGTQPNALRVFPLHTSAGEWESVLIPISEDHAGRPVAALLQHSLDESLKPFYFPRLALLGVMFGGVLVFAIGAVLLARSLTRPLSALTRHAAKIAEGDFTQRAETAGVREVAALGQAFNRMTDSVNASTVSRAYVDNILQSMGEALIVTDAGGRIQTVNRAAETLLGRTGADLAGRPIADLFAPVDLDRAPDPSRDHAALRPRRHSASALAAQVVVRPDGTCIPVAITESELAGDAARATGKIYLLNDVSEAQRAAQEVSQAKDAAETANRAKSEFLANMSHEIRTPMNAVIGFAAMAAEARNDQERNAYLNNIRTAGASMLVVINDVLDFSKVEAGMLDLSWEETDLRALAAQVAELMRPQVEARGLTLALDIDAQVPAGFVCDPQRIRQILLNLVGNAAKFTHAGGIRIKLAPLLGGGEAADGRTGADGRAGATTCEIAFSVQDTGIGIAPQQQQHIFEPFAQADASTTRRYGGTGLGLAICSRLVTLMHGRMVLDSVPGRGSTFSFILPQRKRRTAERLRARSLPLAAPPAHPLTVLVADDNDLNCQLIVAMLRDLPYTIHIAVNGADALALWQRTRPDLILMDVQMPELDGLEVTRRIRLIEAAQGGHQPIIALTAGARAADEDQCLAAGMDAFLTKPLRRAVLFDAIARTLQPGPGRPDCGT